MLQTAATLRTAAMIKFTLLVSVYRLWRTVNRRLQKLVMHCTSTVSYWYVYMYVVIP